MTLLDVMDDCKISHLEVLGADSLQGGHAEGNIQRPHSQLPWRGRLGILRVPSLDLPLVRGSTYKKKLLRTMV